MIGEGTWAAVVVPVETKEGKAYCQFGESGVKRTPLASVHFEILRGPHAGQRITWYGYFSLDNDDVVDRTIRALRACGFVGDDLATFITQEVDQEVAIVIEHEEYKGRMRPRVQWVNAVGGGALKVENTMKGGDLRLFSERLKSRVRAAGVVKGPAAVREQASGDPQNTTDRGGGFDQGAPPEDGDPGPSDDHAGRDTRGGVPPGSDDDIPF